ncbi:hypothetical protein [Leptospira sp. GIMC2001]|uniref:hypothetical protein n=1 Tax=Leptospira sp. GIMC2001 TaxID=1513297 RepID=UPI00234BBD68|nr:hypothetical protein [Leptospira sp. GIMC2001]WCL49172.1 hypothetical protein O4O04_18050 [Leptospira sp. GIMC2001]
MSLFRFLQTEVLEKVVDEFSILENSKTSLPGINFEKFNHESLIELINKYGITETSAIFYNKLVSESKSSAFIKSIDSLEPNLFNLPKIEGKLLIVPSGFYKELPEYAGDGSLIREIAEKFNLESELIPIDTKGSISQNSETIIKFLSQQKDDKIIIFSLSKGGSDLMLALKNQPSIQNKIFVWVSICGLFNGTRLADQFLQRRGVGRLVQDGIFKSLGIHKNFLPEFSHSGGVLSNSETLNVKNLISVIGIPIESHLRGNLLKRFRTLATYGPNDGISLSLDSIIPNSNVYPIWGGDHYFRFKGISELIYKLLIYISELEN